MSRARGPQQDRPPSTFVVQPVPPAGLEPLREIGSVEVFPEVDRSITRAEMSDGASRSDYLFVLGEAVPDAEMLHALSNLRFIGVMEIFSSNLDLEAATELGICVSNIPDIVTETTADFTFGLLMATARRIPEGDKMLRIGHWAQYQSMALLGQMLHRKTLGILGAGKIGRAVAKRAAGFDMRIIYSDREPLDEAVESKLGMTFKPLESLFSESDHLVISVTLTESSRGLVGEELLGLMKPTATIVNTSRGPVLDEDALVSALRSGRPFAAGLDVFHREPPSPNPGPIDEMLELPGVVLTPHLGTAVEETRTRMTRIVSENIAAFHRGERPPNLVNPELFGEAPLQAGDRIG